MIKFSLTVAVAALLTAGFALGQAISRPLKAHAAAMDATIHERRQTMVEEHMASEAALTGAERAAVAAVRADLARDEGQQRAAIKRIRWDYRARTADMAAKHKAELL